MATYPITQFPGGGQGIPDWWISDTSYGLYITSQTIPTSIRDSKQIVYAEQPVAGREGTPQVPTMIDNDVLTFSVEFIRRTQSGNQAVLDALEVLRSAVKSAGDLLNNVTGAGTAGSLELPKVIYQWGTHRIPLLYVIRRLDLMHQSDFVSRLGLSLWTRADFELKVATESKLYRAWQIKQQIAAQTYGRAQSIFRGDGLL